MVWSAKRREAIRYTPRQLCQQSAEPFVEPN